MQRHDALAGARDSAHHGRTTEEIPAVDQRVEARNAGRHPARRIERRRPIAARFARRLHAPVDLDPPAIDDAEGMAAHLEFMPARLCDFKRSDDGAQHFFQPEADHSIGD